MYPCITWQLLNKTELRGLHQAKSFLARTIELTEFFLFHVLLLASLAAILLAPTREVFAQSSVEEATMTVLALVFTVFFWQKDFISKRKDFFRSLAPNLLTSIEMKIKPLIELYFDGFNIFLRLLLKMFKKVTLKVTSLQEKKTLNI